MKEKKNLPKIAFEDVDPHGADDVVDAIIKGPGKSTPQIKPEKPEVRKSGSPEAKKQQPKAKASAPPDFQPKEKAPQKGLTEVAFEQEWLDLLNKIAKQIMTSREKGGQRITKNNIIRVLVKVSLPFICENPAILSNINTEDELTEKLMAVIEKSKGKTS